MSLRVSPEVAALKRKDILWSFISAGFLSLLASSYFDIVRGPLMPAVAAELGLDFKQSGWFLATGTVTATAMTLLMIVALNRWSERTVTACICLGGIAAGVLAPFVSSFALLLGLAAILGMTVSTLGTMSNILLVEGAPTDLRGRFLAGMHTMYGVGSMSAASVVGIGLGRGLHWSTLYAIAVPVYLFLLVFVVLKLKRHWKPGPTTVQSWRLNSAQALVVLCFTFYVAGEVTTSMWMTTFLVKTRGLTISEATPYLTAYFLALTISRLACAFIVPVAKEQLVVRTALAVSVAAFLFAATGPSWAFGLVGLFGPFFPLFLARASRRFPEKWRSITIWAVVVFNMGIGVANLLVGELADRFGIGRAFFLPPVFLVAALVAAHFYFRGETRSPATAGSL